MRVKGAFPPLTGLEYAMFFCWFFLYKKMVLDLLWNYFHTEMSINFHKKLQRNSKEHIGYVYMQPNNQFLIKLTAQLD